MIEAKKFFDISLEFHLIGYGNGFKLVKPGKENQLSMADIEKVPISMYFLDKGSAIRYANNLNLEYAGVNSFKEISGKTAFQVFKKSVDKEIIKNDQKVMTSNQVHFFEEQVTQKNIIFLEALSVKFPWYDEKNQIVGVFGCTILLNEKNLAKNLSLLHNLNFLNKGFFAHQVKNNFYLTKREIEIMELFIKGKSAANIACLLKISKRTIETHIENIKNKAGVSTKAELIEKFI